jgi:hypothetical protein
MNKKLMYIAVGIIIAAILIGAGVWYYKHKEMYVPPPPEIIPSTPLGQPFNSSFENQRIKEMAEIPQSDLGQGTIGFGREESSFFM